MYCRRPLLLVLAGLCFAKSFLSFSCDARFSAILATRTAWAAVTRGGLLGGLIASARPRETADDPPFTAAAAAASDARVDTDRMCEAKEEEGAAAEARNEQATRVVDTAARRAHARLGAAADMVDTRLSKELLENGGMDATVRRKSQVAQRLLTRSVDSTLALGARISCKGTLLE
jgi:hypothetical protein